MQEFSIREKGIAFTHIYPGMVWTPGFEAVVNHWTLLLFKPLFKWAATKADDCAEWMLYGLYDGKEGYFRRNQHGDNIGMKYYEGSPEVRKAIWEHSVVDTGCV
jgi:hypothetical protein